MTDRTANPIISDTTADTLANVNAVLALLETVAPQFTGGWTKQIETGNRLVLESVRAALEDVRGEVLRQMAKEIQTQEITR